MCIGKHVGGATHSSHLFQPIEFRMKTNFKFRQFVFSDGSPNVIFPVSNGVFKFSINSYIYGKNEKGSFSSQLDLINLRTEITYSPTLLHFVC